MKNEGPPEGQDDGVVKYESAHLEGVASEKIVRSSHSTQSTPATILEVRRILYEHLGIACGLECEVPERVDAATKSRKPPGGRAARIGAVAGVGACIGMSTLDSIRRTR